MTASLPAVLVPRDGKVPRPQVAHAGVLPRSPLSGQGPRHRFRYRVLELNRRASLPATPEARARVQSNVGNARNPCGAVGQARESFVELVGVPVLVPPCGLGRRHRLGVPFRRKLLQLASGLPRRSPGRALRYLLRVFCLGRSAGYGRSLRPAFALALPLPLSSSLPFCAACGTAPSAAPLTDPLGGRGGPSLRGVSEFLRILLRQRGTLRAALLGRNRFARSVRQAKERLGEVCGSVTCWTCDALCHCLPGRLQQAASRQALLITHGVRPRPAREGRTLRRDWAFRPQLLQQRPFAPLIARAVPRPPLRRRLISERAARIRKGTQSRR